MERRGFIKTVLVAGGIFIAGAALLGYLMPARKRNAGRARKLKPVAEYPPGVPVKEGDIFVLRQGEELVAFSGRCTHLGCPLSWNSVAREFRCACHGSVFDPTGRPLKGPATAPLKHLVITPGGEVIPG